VYPWLVGAQFWLQRARQLKAERGATLEALMTLDDSSKQLPGVAESLHPEFFRSHV